MQNVVIGILAAIAAVIMLAAGCLITTLFVYLLWNWIVPDVFHGPTLTFFQAFGLNFLCGLLFKSSTTVSKE